jgi:hypothetical protein
MTTSHEDSHLPVSKEGAEEAMQKRDSARMLDHFGKSHTAAVGLYNLMSAI